VLLGAFEHHRALTVVATSGVILAACYMLWMVQRVFFGAVKHEANQNLPDLNKREWTYLLPIVLFIFWIGFYPQTFLRKMEPSIDHWLTQMNFTATARVDAALPSATEREIDAGPDFVVE